MTVEPGRLYRVKGTRRTVRAEYSYSNGAWMVTERDEAGYYVCQRSYMPDRLVPIKRKGR